jgi:hypothetical protein
MAGFGTMSVMTTAKWAPETPAQCARLTGKLT